MSGEVSSPEQFRGNLLTFCATHCETSTYAWLNPSTLPWHVVRRGRQMLSWPPSFLNPIKWVLSSHDLFPSHTDTFHTVKLSPFFFFDPCQQLLTQQGAWDEIKKSWSPCYVTRGWIVEIPSSCLLEGKNSVQRPDRELKPQEAFI